LIRSDFKICAKRMPEVQQVRGVIEHGCINDPTDLASVLGGKGLDPAGRVVGELGSKCGRDPAFGCPRFDSWWLALVVFSAGPRAAGFRKNTAWLGGGQWQADLLAEMSQPAGSGTPVRLLAQASQPGSGPPPRLRCWLQACWPECDYRSRWPAGACFTTPVKHPPGLISLRGATMRPVGRQT
jgi:hypothetical protein